MAGLYYEKKGDRVGPVTGETPLSLNKKGVVKDDTLGWTSEVGPVSKALAETNLVAGANARTENGVPARSILRALAICIEKGPGKAALKFLSFAILLVFAWASFLELGGWHQTEVTHGPFQTRLDVPQYLIPVGHDIPLRPLLDGGGDFEGRGMRSDLRDRLRMDCVRARGVIQA